MHSNELYNGLVSAKQIWFWGAMGLLTLGFVFDRLFSKQNTTPGINIVDISLLSFYTYFLVRAAFTTFTPLLYNARFINYTLLVLFYFIVKHVCSDHVFSKRTITMNPSSEDDKKEVISTTEILVIGLMVTGLVQAIWGLLQLYGMTRSFHSGFKITGTFFNPAPYALYLAAIFPIAFAIVIKELKNEKMKEVWRRNLLPINSFMSSIFHFVKHRLIYYIAVVTVISILLVLPATMNRASWVGAGVSSIFVLNFRYDLINKFRKRLNSTTRKLIMLTGTLIIVASIIIGLYQLKAGSSFGRLFIWEITKGKITEKPLFGYGIGRFEAEYNNWQADYFKNHPEEMDGPKGMAAGNTKYCFNEYLEMACEQGITGLFLFLAIIVSVFWGIKNERISIIKELKNEGIKE